MGLRLLLLLFVSALFVFGAVPQTADAEDEQVSVNAKKKRKAKRKRRAKKKSTPAKSQDEANPYDDNKDDALGQGEDESDTSGQIQGGDEEGAENGSSGVLSKMSADSEGSLRRSGRMEFDERLVKGQAAKSGAVYLFKRVPRKLPGLVPMRRSYRRRIVEPVLGDRELKPAVFSKKKRKKAKAVLNPEDPNGAGEHSQPQPVELDNGGSK